MTGRLSTRATVLAVAAASCLALCTLPAAAQARAIGTAIGPNQFFTGTVLSPTVSSAGTDIVRVVCAGPATTGSPAPNQWTEVKLAPAAGTTVGFTGSAANSIVANLIYSLQNPPIVVAIKIATFKAYSTPVPIPTNIKVPCSGPGQIDFVPEPTSTSARPYDLAVTFQSTGV